MEFARTLKDASTEDERKRKKRDLLIVEAKRDIAESKQVRQTTVFRQLMIKDPGYPKVATFQCIPFLWLHSVVPKTPSS